jgi:hypothetical protein
VADPILSVIRWTKETAVIGLTLVLIVTVLYGVVAGIRYLWSRRRRLALGHRATAEARGEPGREFRLE